MMHQVTQQQAGRSRWKARHTVLSVLFVTWLVAFMDRTVMSVAIPYIAADFKLTPWQSGLVMSAFFASYSISQIPGGMLADIFGVRRVATVAMLWWSAFTAVTGAAGNFGQMVAVRAIFGLGEGVYPACVFKTIAVWFPKRERATANAIKMAAGPLGAALSPLFVVGVMATWGWRHVFYLLFIPGIVATILFWIFVTDKPSESARVSAEELAEIEEGDHILVTTSEPKPSLRSVISEPNVLKYFFALFAFDIAYWGFTSWLPTYLVKARHFSMTEMGVAASVPFFAGTIGSVLGGWISDRLFLNSRKTPIVIMQLLSALLLFLSYQAQSTIVLVICQALAGFCLSFFFSCFWALPMTTISKERMGVASGFINTAGQIAAFISPVTIGYLVTISDGGFGLTFGLLIVSLLASCAVVLTIPGRSASATAL
ncbi:MFS transporter [Sphingomonas sp. LB2R24]|uniref:MFS transporter n=1 Tax=Sphingomonas sorbitolis TaxID=3096165 RepID=UPI002FC978C9